MTAIETIAFALACLLGTLVTVIFGLGLMVTIGTLVDIQKFRRRRRNERAVRAALEKNR